MSFFQDIATAIETEAKKAEAQLAPLWAKLKPAVEATAQELAGAAVSAVIAQIPAVTGGTEKFGAAAAAVATSLGSAGKTAAADLIGAAVQLAFNEIQSLRPTQ